MEMSRPMGIKKLTRVHESPISTVWTAEREIPNSEDRELCVVKVTDGTIEGKTLTKFSGVSVILKDYLRQINLVKHDNLVKFYGYGTTRSTLRVDGEESFVLICEYCSGGDLEDHLKHRSEPLSPVHILAYAKQILDGLCFLHNLRETANDAKNTIHGDIKPKNLFLCDYRHGVGYMTIKIGDHDDPGHMDESVTTSQDTKHLRGTVLYMSPELISKNGKVGRKTDSWSLGCVLLRMCLQGKQMQFSQPLTQIVRDESSFGTWSEFSNFIVLSGATPLIPSDLEKDLSDIISGCLVHNQQERLHANGLAALYNEQLTSSSRIFSSSEESRVEVISEWIENSDSGLTPCIKRLGPQGHVELSENCFFWNSWRYVLDKLQRAAFSGPIHIKLQDSNSFTALHLKKLSADLRHLKDYVVRIRFQRFSGDAAYELFRGIIFPNLVTFVLDESCVVRKPDLQSLFAAAPNLAELFLVGTRLPYWDESVTRSVPKSLRCMEWRWRRDLDLAVLQTLHEMDFDEKFLSLRNFLERNETLTLNKNIGSISDFAESSHLAYGLFQPPAPSYPLDTNYLKLLGKGVIFEGSSPQLRQDKIESISDNCCPIQHASCVLTACPNRSSRYAVTITKTLSGNDWTAFWMIVERQHRGFQGFPGPPTELTLEDYDLGEPLPKVMLEKMIVVAIFLKNCTNVDSSQWSKWVASNATWWSNERNILC